MNIIHYKFEQMLFRFSPNISVLLYYKYIHIYQTRDICCMERDSHSMPLFELLCNYSTAAASGAIARTRIIRQPIIASEIVRTYMQISKRRSFPSLDLRIPPTWKLCPIRVSRSQSLTWLWLAIRYQIILLIQNLAIITIFLILIVQC